MERDNSRAAAPGQKSSPSPASNDVKKPVQRKPQPQQVLQKQAPASKPPVQEKAQATEPGETGNDIQQKTPMSKSARARITAAAMNAKNLQNTPRTVRSGDLPKAGPEEAKNNMTADTSEFDESQMMKTKTTDIGMREDKTSEDSVKPSKKGKKKGSGAGSNTLMSIVKAIVYIVFVGVVSIFLAIAIITVANDVFAFVKSDEPVEITLNENTTLDELADLLHDKGVIKYPEIFKLYAKYKKDDQKYIAGTYTINGMMNYSTLLGEFKEKFDYGTVRVTIPEGYTTDEIIDLFVSLGIGTREGFVDVIQNDEFDFWFLDEMEENGISEDRIYRLDGYLFPDTYEFYKGSSERTVIRKMLKRFSQIFTSEYRKQCETLGYTVDQIVTLASIIEKEAASPSEFFLVSSVFHNRLNNRWVYPRLESDATVVYVIQHETGERNVDLTYDTPYNTYLYDGLTPGPISNPSASAMLAALSPQETNYFYFVSNNGTTYFSETKAQHDALVEQFRQEALEKETEPVGLY